MPRELSENETEKFVELSKDDKDNPVNLRLYSTKIDDLLDSLRKYGQYKKA